MHRENVLGDRLVLRDWFAPQRRLLQQAQRITELEQELTRLQQQNDSMREGMRRCVTCEYRIDYKQRQGNATAAPIADPVSEKE